MEEITIKRENLEDVFSNLKVVKSLMNLYREDEDKLSINYLMRNIYLNL